MQFRTTQALQRSGATMEQAPKPREKDVEQALVSRIGGERQVPTRSGFIDVQTTTTIYEVKDFRKWKAAIGQILVYRRYFPDHKPTIYLFGKAPQELKSLIREHCDELGVDVEWHHEKVKVSGKVEPAPAPIPDEDDDAHHEYDGEYDDEYPSIEDYVWALRSVSPTERQQRMLQAHYDAPEHTITATQLAYAMGYKSFAAANLQYGRFAERVREALDWWYLEDIHICIFNSFSYLNDEWHWIMHPELATALEELGWVQPVD
jgi:hypothetical protein